MDAAETLGETGREKKGKKGAETQTGKKPVDWSLEEKALLRSIFTDPGQYECAVNHRGKICVKCEIASAYRDALTQEACKRHILSTTSLFVTTTIGRGHKLRVMW